MSQIYELLPKVAREVDGITKGQRNDAQKYDFRGIDDVLNIIGPAFAKYGITLSQRITDHRVEHREGVNKYGKPQDVYHATLILEVEPHAPDGSSVTWQGAGEALDYSGDKATNKAMSAAYKYAFFFGMCIPVLRGAVDDSDRTPVESDEPKVSVAYDAALDQVMRCEDGAALTALSDRIASSAKLTDPQKGTLAAEIGERMEQLNGQPA